jgi:hypothetical protein
MEIFGALLILAIMVVSLLVMLGVITIGRSVKAVGGIVLLALLLPVFVSIFRAQLYGMGIISSVVGFFIVLIVLGMIFRKFLGRRP